MPGQGQHLISFALPQATLRPSPSPFPVYHSIHSPQQLANQTNSTHNSHDAVDRANQHKYQKYKSQIESKSKEGEGGHKRPPSGTCTIPSWTLQRNCQKDVNHNHESKERQKKKKKTHTENVKNLICLLGLVTVLLLLPSLPPLLPISFILSLPRCICIVCWGLLICFVVVASSTDWLPAACVKWYLAFEIRAGRANFAKGVCQKKNKFLRRVPRLPVGLSVPLPALTACPASLPALSVCLSLCLPCLSPCLLCLLRLWSMINPVSGLAAQAF